MVVSSPRRRRLRWFAFLSVASGFGGVSAAAQIAALDSTPAGTPGVSVEIRHRLLPAPAKLPDLGASVSFQVDPGGTVVGRRILSDPAAHRIFGYAVVLQPQTNPGIYNLSFRDLSAAEMQLPDGEPAMESPQKYPTAHAVAEGDQATVEVATLSIGDERTVIVDEIHFRPPQSLAQAATLGQTEQRLSAHSAAVLGEILKRGLKPAGSTPPTLTPADTLRLQRSVQEAVPRNPLHSSEVPRTFTAADASFFIIEPRVSVNGGPESSVRVFTGNLIFFYFPGKGRHILSLLPRPELGFVRVGEVSGGLLKWAVNGDTFSIRSTERIVPGDDPFWVYGLHDSGWLPVPRPNPDRVLGGTVGVDEIRLLQKEVHK